MPQSRETIEQKYSIQLVNDGVLTLSFRGSVSELGIRLLSRPDETTMFLEGSSTTLDIRDIPTPLSVDFYNAMHGLITDTNQSSANITPPDLPADILGKGFTIETRPARLQNMTGDATDESISVWCTSDAALHMSVTGQDLSFPSRTESLIFNFASNHHTPSQNLSAFTTRLTRLIQSYGSTNGCNCSIK